MSIFFIIAGASLGASARFLIDQYFRKFTAKPFGTFTVNIVGSFLIGLTFGKSDHWQDFLAIGFAGAFTTWSTFVLDLYLAYELKRYRAVVINLLASLMLGLLAAAFGYALAS